MNSAIEQMLKNYNVQNMYEQKEKDINLEIQVTLYGNTMKQIQLD